MSIDRSINLAYGLVIRPNDTYALNKLFEDSSSTLAKPSDIILRGVEGGFYKKWGLASDSNANWWTGHTPEALIVYVPSTFIDLLDSIESNNTPFPLLASEFPPASETEKALLEKFRSEHKIPSPINYVIWAQTS